jgi:hypothetical protein
MPSSYMVKLMNEQGMIAHAASRNEHGPAQFAGLCANPPSPKVEDPGANVFLCRNGRAAPANPGFAHAAPDRHRSPADPRRRVSRGRGDAPMTSDRLEKTRYFSPPVHRLRAQSPGNAPPPSLVSADILSMSVRRFDRKQA